MADVAAALAREFPRPSAGDEPWRLTASEAVAAIRSGRLTAQDLAESCLERATDCECETRAFVGIDAATIRAEAARSAALGPETPLAGVPFAVKDNLDTALAATAYGSPIWAGHRPKADAAAVALARRAGGTFFGKTATTEFAAMTPAATTNPRDHRRSPGGSSSGSAAAVAAGAVPLALGTQTGGSVIRPAAFCGVVGFKPSFGAIPRAGLKVSSDSLDTIGMFARSVADCALLFDAITGTTARNGIPGPDARPTLAVILGPAADRATAETLALVEHAARACALAGATIIRPLLPPAVTAAFHVHDTIMYGETLGALSWEWEAAPDRISPRLTERLVWASRLTPTEIAEARLIHETGRRAFDAFACHVDAILTPSAAGEAPTIASGSTGDMSFNQLWTALHAPCVTVPAGTGPGGLPLGLQIVTSRGTDRNALAWAEWVQHALH